MTDTDNVSHDLTLNQQSGGRHRPVDNQGSPITADGTGDSNDVQDFGHAPDTTRTTRMPTASSATPFTTTDGDGMLSAGEGCRV